MKVYKIIYADTIQGVETCEIIAQNEAEALSVFRSISFAPVLYVGGVKRE